MENMMMEEIMETTTDAVKEEASEEKQEQRQGFLQDERGVGVIEIVLILVILIGLVLVFKEQITAIVNTAFTTISGDAGKILD